ncbi:MAG: hypothetical protein WBN50_00010 [Lutimonas sp.]
MKLYGVDRTTIETWITRYNLPMIEISSHSKYIRKDDLIHWEDRMTKSKIKLVLNES